MGRYAIKVETNETQKVELQRWVGAHGTPQQVVKRSRIILLAAEGLANAAIARLVKVNVHTARLWRNRFAKEGVGCVWEIAPGRGRKARYSAQKIQSIIDATLQMKPAGATHWSCRSMAKEQGVSKALVNRIWQGHNLQPHRIKTFKLSRDKQFVEKLTDVIGLYMNPPDKALVLCVDEKSQIQALDRTQPGLPMKKGRCGTMTHDYKRNGTTSLFAALDFLAGKVIGQCFARHRHQEFLKFLKKLDAEFPELDLHLIMDNYATHKHPKVQTWLKKHPRFHFHFTPTSSSWANMVERWFGLLTDKRIRRGSFVSVADLISAIGDFTANWNENPKPFVWTATLDSILQKLKRCPQTFNQISK